MDNTSRHSRNTAITTTDTEEVTGQVFKAQQSIKIERAIPSPEEIAKYKEVMSDLPERIVKQFEEDSVHIRELQKRKQEADIAFDKRSQYMAFVIIMFGFVGTLLLAYFDKDYAAVATAIGTVALIFKNAFSKTDNKIEPSKNDND